LRLEALDLRLPPSSLFDPAADTLVPVLPPPDVGTPAQLAAPTGTSQPPAPSPAPLTPTEPPAEAAPPPTTTAGTTQDPTFLPAQKTNLGPQIVNFQAVEVVEGLWKFTGDVIDEAPGGLTVHFGGQPVSLQGVTTTTDAGGHFDKSVLLNTDGSDNGLASAQTFDAGAQASNIALYNISPG
jgi:hypothetical protein